jgi:hypothetical protein
MVPYLKGVHHTLNSWRSGSDADGWKSPRTHKPEDLTAEPPTRRGARTQTPPRSQFESRTRDQPPRFVKAVPRFKDDIEALMKLTESETPPKIGVRPKHSAAVWFTFGDASGKGPHPSHDTVP